MRATREGGSCVSSCAIDAFASGPASCAFSAGDNRRNKNPAKDKSEARVRLPVNVDFIALPLKEPEFRLGSENLSTLWTFQVSTGKNPEEGKKLLMRQKGIPAGQPVPGLKVTCPQSVP